jgi:hypothetical protein
MIAPSAVAWLRKICTLHGLHPAWDVSEHRHQDRPSLCTHHARAKQTSVDFTLKRRGHLCELASSEARSVPTIQMVPRRASAPLGHAYVDYRHLSRPDERIVRSILLGGPEAGRVPDDGRAVPPSEVGDGTAVTMRVYPALGTAGALRWGNAGHQGLEEADRADVPQRPSRVARARALVHGPEHTRARGPQLQDVRLG